MKDITQKTILEEEICSRQVIMFGIFLVMGILIMIYPFTTIQELNQESLLFIFCTWLLGVPFTFLIGLRNILRVTKIYRLIKQGEFEVREDILTDKYLVGSSSNGDDDDSYCQFTFKNYSELTNKNVKVTRREYEKAKEGDKYYLVFVSVRPFPIRHYSQKEYFYRGKLTHDN